MASPEAGRGTRASGGAGQSGLLTKTRAHPPTSGTKGAVGCPGKVAPGCLDRRLWPRTTAGGPSAWRNATEEPARGRACGHCLSPVQSRGLWGGGWRLRLSGVGYPRVTTVREEAVFVKRSHMTQSLGAQRQGRRRFGFGSWGPGGTAGITPSTRASRGGQEAMRRWRWWREGRLRSGRVPLPQGLQYH